MSLRKAVDPYEYMDDWGKFNEKTLLYYIIIYNFIILSYYRCRLHACEKSFQWLWNRKRWIIVFKNDYF